jgi:hypothetical protein
MLPDRFGHDPDTKLRFPGFVPDLHSPFGIGCQCPDGIASKVRDDSQRMLARRFPTSQAVSVQPPENLPWLT